jgi:polyhydroxyalkanoate synthesis regulator phasin
MNSDETKEAKKGKGKKNIRINIELKDLLDMLKKTVGHGKNALANFEQALDEKLQRLIQKGEISANEGKKIKEDMKEKAGAMFRKVNTAIESGVQKALKSMNLATAQDLKKIEDRLDELMKKVSNPSGKTPPKSGKASAPKKKSASRKTPSSAKN